MLTERKCDVMKNRAACMNRVHDFANVVVPAIIDGLKQGFKLTNGSQFYAKDKDRLQAVLDNAAKRSKLSQGHEGRKGSSAWLRTDEYNVTLEISDNYPVSYHDGGGQTVDYYKRTIYMWNNRDGVEMQFNELPMHTQAELVAAQMRVEEINKELSELQTEKHGFSRLLGR